MQAFRTLRGCLLLVAAFAVVAFDSIEPAAADPTLVKRTYTYKTVGDCEIQADVYRPEGDAVQPVVVWIHGGALIVGSRQGVSRNLKALCQAEGFILVSIDYRLAPEVKVPAIIEDLQDAIRWVREKGPELFHCDPNKLVVAGGSAGGHLTMSAGVWVKPPPTALVAYWGYGDIDKPWLTEPSPHHGHPNSLMPMEKMKKAVGPKVISGTGAGNQAARGSYYRYLRQNGLWTKEVSGFDPATQQRELDRYCPVRNITSEYPPILMVHGTKDTDVPYSKSADMAKELARHNVPHELITVPGGGHGLGGADPKLRADAHARALEFIKQHLK